MIPLPTAQEKYDRAMFQQLLNAVRELQQAALIPKQDIPILDSGTGAPQVIRADGGTVEAFDP